MLTRINEFVVGPEVDPQFPVDGVPIGESTHLEVGPCLLCGLELTTDGVLVNPSLGPDGNLTGDSYCLDCAEREVEGFTRA